MGISLQQIDKSDIAELVKVHTDAFKADQFSNFMLSGKPPGAHESLMERSLNAWFSDPTYWMVKAVNDDGAIVGWACWLTKAMDNTEKQVPSNATDTKETKGTSPPSETGPTTSSAETRDKSVSKPPPSQAETPETPARIVGRQMRNDTMKWELDSMTENKYLVLQGLVTSPEYQCRGVGSQLINWGVERADARQLPCWCHASPAGNKLYLKAGFKELGSSEYDLGEFGRYTFRYMLRPVS
ncbi:hypothetical protein Dda_5329 [Drechslerella dactyloides]|uniref:N-acetyltransferase domain-containing protein n=1 Tax=Drechslerella dactyloides TaxID=74499 RepID=A0AAD6NHF7_DREDA|nr:hypothetical protein Dda_5329 [Drechslerella dactyloides]